MLYLFINVLVVKREVRKKAIQKKNKEKKREKDTPLVLSFPVKYKVYPIFQYLTIDKN